MCATQNHAVAHGSSLRGARVDKRDNTWKCEVVVGLYCSKGFSIKEQFYSSKTEYLIKIFYDHLCNIRS